MRFACGRQAHQSTAIAEASDDCARLCRGGGNPLALRLVVGWSRAQAALCLEDLRQAAAG